MPEPTTHKEDSIHLRAAQSQHLSEVIQIAREARLSEWTIADYTNEVNRKDSIFLVATDASERVLGFIVGRHVIDNPSRADSFAEIYNIAVHSSLERKGIGSQLLKSFISTLGDLGIAEIFLEVRSKNIRAIEFYCSQGFEVSGIRKSYYPADDAILMKSIL